MNNSVLLEYVIYGGIFIVGLIILFFMNQAKKKPVSVTALAKTKDSIARIDELIGECEKKYNVYTLLTKTLRLTSEIGDLVVLAEDEVTRNRNIAYDGALSAFQQAAKVVGEIDITYDMAHALTSLTQAKNALSGAKSLIEEIGGKKN